MVRKKAAAKPRTGRPPKGGQATSHMVGVRLTDADHAALVALQAHEQETASLVGLTLSPAYVLRLLLRREAEKRGLIEPMAQAS